MLLSWTNILSVEFFEELARNETYCTRTLRTNYISISQILKNTKELNCSH